MNNVISKIHNAMSCASIYLLALVAAFMFGCGDSDDTAGGTSEETEGAVAIANKTITGVSQKGPFVNGSAVRVYELDGKTLAQTGNSFTGKIASDKGDFKVNVVELASQYALLEADGFYRNEVTGKKSASRIALNAVTDLMDRENVNINLLTHLEYERVLYLTENDSLDVVSAKKKAEKEVLESFEIEGDFKNAEDLSIFGDGDGDAALLAISIMMQGDLNEGDFSERLANYASDIEKDGKWNDGKAKTKVADWTFDADYASIRANINSWNLGDVPSFEKILDEFWWTVFGLGECEKERQGDVLQNSNEPSKYYGAHFVCDDKAWRLATDIEKDTYKWKQGEDGDVKQGDVVKENCYVFDEKVWRAGDNSDCSLNLRGCTKLRKDTVGLGSDKVWYICDAQSWRNATTYEKDTFGWSDSTDGSIKKGNVTDSVYVFDKDSWRVTSPVEGKLGGCIAAITDSVGKVGSTYYICKNSAWTEAVVIEYDTYRWAAGIDGDSKWGSVDAENCYVFENKVWRAGNSSDCSLNLRGCTKPRKDTVGLGSDKVWYICDAQSWRNATTYEKDTFGWSDSTDGSIKKGNVTDSVYVFDKNAWRTSSAVEGKLGGCVSAIADSVGVMNGTYYICKNRAWTEATTIEYDTYRWAAGKDGDSKWGSAESKNCYVFENETWRAGNNSDCSLDLRGCTKLRADSVGLGNDRVWYTCENKMWRKSTDIEKDTATWGTGAFDGEIRAGQVNVNIYYIYETAEKYWRNATTIEKDTYDYVDGKDWIAGVDGEIKKGSLTDSIYVFDATAWRTADAIESSLGGCVDAIKDSVGSVGSVYYICNPRKWEMASTLQYDTYRVGCSKDGALFSGVVNHSIKYVCDEGVFRIVNDKEIRADKGCTSYNNGGAGRIDYSNYVCDAGEWKYDHVNFNYGELVDERDGKVYKTVGVGTQMWMAENLNYVEDNLDENGRSWCYGEKSENCLKYGRLYQWTYAMSLSSKYLADYVIPALTYPHQGICPSGWHLPQRQEWNTLVEFVDQNNGDEKVSLSLIDGEYVSSETGKVYKGINSFGMSILTYDGGYYAWYLSSEEHPSYGDGTIVYGFDICYSSYDVYGFLGKSDGHAVRCVRD